MNVSGNHTHQLPDKNQLQMFLHAILFYSRSLARLTLFATHLTHVQDMSIRIPIYYPWKLKGH